MTVQDKTRLTDPTHIIEIDSLRRGSERFFGAGFFIEFCLLRRRKEKRSLRRIKAIWIAKNRKIKKYFEKTVDNVERAAYIKVKESQRQTIRIPKRKRSKARRSNARGGR